MRSKFVLSAVLTVLLLTFLPGLKPASSQAPRRIEVVARKYEFAPAEITLKKDEPVVLVLMSADVAHGLRFKELGFDANAGKGQTTETTFTPRKTGTFVGHCSVFCGLGHGSMTLTLHVVE